MSSNNYVNVTVRANQDGSRSYYQHDDRDRGGAGAPDRGRNRKWRKGRRGRPPPSRGESSQFIDKDGDVNMGNEESSADHRNRFNPYGVSRGRGGYAKGNRQWIGGKEYRDSGTKHYDGNQSSGVLWSKVQVPYGRNFSKDFLLRTITHACQVSFVPVNYQFDGNSAVFFVDNKAAAVAIAKLNRQLSSPDGPKITIIVRPSPPPTVALTNEVVDTIKGCVNRRFTTTSNILDLSYFHLDPVFKKEGLFLPLSRPNVMSVVVKTVNETATNLQILELTGNKLNSLDLLSNLLKKLSGLRILLLAQNQISRPSELDKIRDLPLEELTLNGNPLCSIYKDHSDYVE